ncbi:MAG TPA: hypothetical protein VJ963_04040 [Bacteroidales bacterium]|nr:hypothetical protein [Bacteroidales bacterium]
MKFRLIVLFLLGISTSIYSSVTIGYDVPWKNMNEALVAAALKTEMIS